MGLALLGSKIKKLKFASSFTSPDFFFKKNSVMKCLRSKKRLNVADYTTYSRVTKKSPSCELRKRRRRRRRRRSRWLQQHISNTLATH
jgi:hypothetical protein